MLSKSPIKCEKTGKKGSISERTFISDVLKMTSMKDSTRSLWPTGAARTADALFAECERDIEKEKKPAEAMDDDDEDEPRARRVTEKFVEAKADGDGDLLDKLWPMARPFLPKKTLTYNVFVVTCLVILKNNDHMVSAPWDAYFEGQEVLRWIARLYPSIGKSLYKELLGQATPKGERWDIKSKNLVFLPSYAMLKNYAGTPYSLRSVLTLGANDTIISAISTFKTAGVDPCVVAITFDKVHVNKQSMIVYEDGEPYLLGGATRSDLQGAMLKYSDLAGKSLVPEAELADGFLTLVLSDMFKKTPHGIFVKALPIGAENAALLYAVFKSMAEDVFGAGGYLIHGGGDGHVANLAALRDFKAWTTGTTATVLATCATAQDVPFFYGTDGIQHDFKHAEQTGYENPIILPGYEPFQMDTIVHGLRGVRDDGKLVGAGMIDASKYKDRQLASYFNTRDKAVVWHTAFAKPVTVEVLQRRDAMKTSNSVAIAKVAGLLRQLELREPGLGGPARYTTLLEQMWACSRGRNVEDKAVAPEENAEQYKTVVDFLSSWKAECLTREPLPRTDRPRGGLTMEQFSFWPLNYEALKDHIDLAKSNAYSDSLRPDLPTSGVNETPVHEELRRCCPGMRIDDVARNSAKVVNGIGLAADMARTWVTVNGSGTYMAAVDQSFEVRSAAIDAMDASGERTFSLTRNEAEGRTTKKTAKAAAAKAAAAAATTTAPVGPPPPPLLATAPAPAPAPAAASVAPAVQLAHVKAVAEATALELERNRVGRDKFASGKFGAPKSARSNALERRLESPQEWLDENSKGNFSKFEISALVVLEHGSKAGAARFVEGRDRAIAVGSTYGGKGMNFQAWPRSGVKFQYPIAYANVVAACFGKASAFIDGQATTKKSHSGVAVVTLLLAHQAKLQVVSFQLSKHEEDKNLCKMLMNQKDGIAKMVPAKHAEGDSVSEHTAALVGMFRRGGDDPNHAPLDLARQLGDGWETVTPSNALAFSAGMKRISDDLGAFDAPTLAGLMAKAPPQLTLGGLFGPASGSMTAAAPAREINLWVEHWEADALIDGGDAAKQRFWDKFVGAKMLDDDEGELFEADIVGISWYEGQWVADVDANGKAVQCGLGDLWKYVRNVPEQPAGIVLVDGAVLGFEEDDDDVVASGEKTLGAAEGDANDSSDDDDDGAEDDEVGAVAGAPGPQKRAAPTAPHPVAAPPRKRGR